MTSAIWTPAWYELDQSVVTDDRDVFFFHVSSSEPLVFSNLPGPHPFFEAEATVVRIEHALFGELRAILAEGLDYSLINMDGSHIHVDAEENPGHVEETGQFLNPLQFSIDLADVDILQRDDRRRLSGRSNEDLARLHAERKLRWARILGPAYMPV